MRGKYAPKRHKRLSAPTNRIYIDNFEYLLKDSVSLPMPRGLVQQSVRISPPLEADLYTQISKKLVNKTLLILEDCDKQDEKGRKRMVKG